MSDWYSQIEEPVRELVRYLRNNGVNTVSSCGHEMLIQADLIPDGELNRIHSLLHGWLPENQADWWTRVDYTITIHLNVTRGVILQCFADIKLEHPRES